MSERDTSATPLEGLFSTTAVLHKTDSRARSREPSFAKGTASRWALRNSLIRNQLTLTGDDVLESDSHRSRRAVELARTPLRTFLNSRISCRTDARMMRMYIRIYICNRSEGASSQEPTLDRVGPSSSEVAISENRVAIYAGRKSKSDSRQWFIT